MKSQHLLFVCLFSLILSSCGGIQKMAVNTTAEILAKGSEEVFTDSNWPLVADALPASLKTVEGLYYVNPDNEDLIVTLAVGYSGLAFSINETRHLFEDLKDSENEFHKNQAVANYSKALKYGMKYLKIHEIEFQDLVSAAREGNHGVEKLLDDKLKVDSDLKPVYYTAQAWAGLISLQRNDPILMSQLPFVKGIFDWVCKNRPNINFGACDMFYGGYEAGRPRALGGNPEKGKEHFLKAIKENPENLLTRVVYMQYYLIPLSDEVGYNEQKRILDAALEKFEKENLKWNPAFKLDAPNSDDHANINLFNAIAKERFSAIVKNEKEFF